VRQPYPPKLTPDERRGRLVEVLRAIAHSIESGGERLERETMSEQQVVLLWRPGQRGETRLAWRHGDEAPAAPPGTIVIVDGAAPPAEGSYVDARRRRYRIRRREAALGRAVRRVFHYHGIRLMEELPDRSAQ
jgi:hypothetical protein